MKKISRFIKDNYKFLIGVIVGLLLSGTGVYAANTIYSKNVTYDNSNSGLSATNVQDALDETYTKCFPPVLATKKIIDLYNDGSSINTVHIGGDTSNPQVKLNIIQGIMLDNNGDYRYYGANPNNYVTFNDELWRIIGAFINIDDGTGKKETRLKIIRDEVFGEYSWDSSVSTVNSGYGVNDWSQADLMTELNTLYYNSTSGICYNDRNNVSTTCDFTSTGLDSIARGMIDNAVYHLGSTSNPYGGLYAYEHYNNERGTKVYGCSTDDGACPRSTKWTGKVALMYPSDYLYATNLSFCTYTNTSYDLPICKNNNWLFSSNDRWTITPALSRYGVFVTSKSIYESAYGSHPRYFSPVVYLKSDITITGGTGTSSAPYILG